MISKSKITFQCLATFYFYFTLDALHDARVGEGVSLSGSSRDVLLTMALLLYLWPDFYVKLPIQVSVIKVHYHISINRSYFSCLPLFDTRYQPLDRCVACFAGSCTQNGYQLTLHIPVEKCHFF